MLKNIFFRPLINLSFQLSIFDYRTTYISSIAKFCKSHVAIAVISSKIVATIISNNRNFDARCIVGLVCLKTN